jgi:rubrerythrin
MSARNTAAGKARRREERLVRDVLNARFADNPRHTVCRECGHRRITTPDRICHVCVGRLLAATARTLGHARKVHLLP